MPRNCAGRTTRTSAPVAASASRQARTIVSSVAGES
jgi:hypothetical protein